MPKVGKKDSDNQYRPLLDKGLCETAQVVARAIEPSLGATMPRALEFALENFVKRAGRDARGFDGDFRRMKGGDIVLPAHRLEGMKRLAVRLGCDPTLMNPEDIVAFVCNASDELIRAIVAVAGEEWTVADSVSPAVSRASTADQYQMLEELRERRANVASDDVNFSDAYRAPDGGEPTGADYGL